MNHRLPNVTLFMGGWGFGKVPISNFIWAGVRINKAIINVVYIFKIKADD